MALLYCGVRLSEYCCAVLLIFQSFVYSVCYAMALLYCGVRLSEAKLVVRDPIMRIYIFIDPFKYEFLRYF